MAIPRVVTITRRRFITDNTPNQFTFDDVSDADLSTNYESNAIEVAGLIGSATISVVGGTYSINGGSFVSTPGTVENGDEVIASGTSPAVNSAQTDVTVIIGTVSDTFSIVTVELDTAPDPFDFTDEPLAGLIATYESDTITITGITSTAPVTIDTTGLSGAVGYSKNGGSYTTALGTAIDGDTFKVRLTTGNDVGTTYSTTLTVGGVSGTFSATTSAYTPSLDFSNLLNSQYLGLIFEDI